MKGLHNTVPLKSAILLFSNLLHVLHIYKKKMFSLSSSIQYKACDTSSRSNDQSNAIQRNSNEYNTPAWVHDHES